MTVLETAPADNKAMILERLADIVGAANVHSTPEDMASFMVEPRDRYHGKALCVVVPGSTQEVSRVMQFADGANLPVVPQGGNTGLVGGQIPFETGREVVVSLKRMNKVRAIDTSSDTMTVEAGCILENVQRAAAEADRLFPLSLASEGSCTIGGNIASNAGGTAVLAYGNTRDLVLGLEVVLPDGRIWDGLRALRKDNTGYDLKDLFVGSEGTLGIVTAAVVKLFALPRSKSTAFVALPTLESALDLLGVARKAVGPALTAFEFIPRIGMDFVFKHAPATRDPFAEAHPWYVLMELSSGVDDALDEKLETILAEGYEAGFVSDAILTKSEQETQDLWLARMLLSEVQRDEGGSIKHDIAVPVARLPEFVHKASDLVQEIVPGCRPIPFGHLGDGNVHFNVSQPVGADKQEYLARWDEVSEAVHELVLSMGGTFSAEHGIGRMKRDKLARTKSAVEMDLMRKIKKAFDPKGLLNPGKVL